MQIWVNKNCDEKPTADYSSAYIFSLNRKGYSTMFTNLNNTWLRIGAQSIKPIYEDLFLIGLSVYSADKRISRDNTFDKWTRDIEISIPVIEVEKWLSVKQLWDVTLKFLTGDYWNLKFRKSDQFYSNRERQSRIKIDLTGCTSISLFSGGLDSFCGAIDLLNRGESPCLFGHNEYPKLRLTQEILCDIFKQEYPAQATRFISFTANSRAPYNINEKLSGSENTSRGRSLLFLCAALSIAGILGNTTPVYIPENGFIGLNIPLTYSRKGTCSTRTTHPHFLRCFNEIIHSVGIQNNIENFFAYKTKREIINLVKEYPVFSKGVAETISCSHPCLPRWAKEGDRTYPRNCGYCYPCLIRKSSLLDIENTDGDYTHESISLEFLKHFSDSEKTNDLAALISSVYRYLCVDADEIRRLIKCTGKLSITEIEMFLHVYKSTMDDLIELFSSNKDIEKYIGIN